MTKVLNKTQDEKLFGEMLEKLNVMGLSPTWSEYRNNKDKYLRLVEEYDEAVRTYLYKNIGKEDRLARELVEKKSLPDVVAYSEAHQMLIAEVKEKIAQKKISIRALKEFEYPVVEEKEDIKNDVVDVDNLVLKLSNLKDNEGLALIDQPAKKMGKHSNYLSLQMVVDGLHVSKQHQVEFKTALSRYNGSLREFLYDYTHHDDTPSQQETAPEKQHLAKKRSYSVKKAQDYGVKTARKLLKKVKIPHIRIHFDLNVQYAKKNRLKRKALRRISDYKRKYQLQRRLLLHWQKEYWQKLKAYPLKISFNPQKYLEPAKLKVFSHEKEFWQKNKKPLIYAAASLSFVIGGYSIFQKLYPLKPVIKTENITCSINSPLLKNDRMARSRLLCPDFTDFTYHPDLLDQSALDVSGTSDFWQTLAEGEALDQHDYNLPCPLVRNDALAHVPNVDFFNYCFNKSNESMGKQNKYGISLAMYNAFIKENKPLANMYRIKSYQNLSFDQARVIAKAQIYDKYDIGFMHNRSIAAYLYNILAHEENSDIAALAQGVSDFYEVKGKALSLAQQEALDKLAEGKSVRLNDWRQMIAVINETSVNAKEEGQLFELLRANLLQNGSVTLPEGEKIVNQPYQDNVFYAFEPTFGNDKSNIDTQSFADNIFFSTPDIQLLGVAEYDSLLTQRKDRDLETFSRIYMQCCYDNFVKLEHGQKSQTFREANQALHRYGLSNLSVGLHCAGMSIASLCQATDKFSEENPESPVTKAVKEILYKCRNVHYCNSLRDDLASLTQTVVKSKNLQKDIAAYMKKNKHAIVFGWAPRGNGRYHHQTFFQPAEVASSDAYTYSAFNNQHWGNENTFARYMRSRSRYGNGGYFADIGLSIDRVAEKHVKKEVSQYKKQLQQYNDSVAKAEAEAKARAQTEARSSAANIVYDLTSTMFLSSGLQR